MRRGIKLQFGRSHQAVQTVDGDVYVIIVRHLPSLLPGLLSGSSHQSRLVYQFVGRSSMRECNNRDVLVGSAWEHCPCAAVNSYEGRVRLRMISAAVVRDFFLIIAVVVPIVVSAMVAPCV